jgi:hypothetical protein
MHMSLECQRHWQLEAAETSVQQPAAATQFGQAPFLQYKRWHESYGKTLCFFW